MRLQRPRLSSLLSPNLVDRLSRFDPRAIRFDDRVQSWKQAQDQSTGYEDPEITNRLVMASQAVRDGRALAQRDGILLEREIIDWPLSACLLLEILGGDSPCVVDLGGGLGGTYRIMRSLLPAHISLDWLVVEQPSVVEVGEREFSTQELRFCEFEKFGFDATRNTLLLISNSLQYIPEPEATVRSFIDGGVFSVIVQGVPTVDTRLAKIPSIQRVPGNMVKSSYPAWLFSPKIFSALASSQMIVARSWTTSGAANFSRSGRRITWIGAHLKMNTSLAALGES